MKKTKKRKLIQKSMITIMIVVILCIMVKQVQASKEKVYFPLTTFSYSTILENDKGAISIHELAYQEDDQYYEVYYLTPPFEVIENIGTIFFMKELEDEKIRNILLNGYPYQSIETLRLPNTIRSL